MSALVAPAALAQSFPAKPVKVLVGYSPGGAVDIVARTVSQKAIASPEVRERMASVGGEVTPGTTEQFGALIRSERLRYEKLIREAKLKPD